MPARTQLIFWQGDVAAIARDLIGKGLRFEDGRPGHPGRTYSCGPRAPDGVVRGARGPEFLLCGGRPASRGAARHREGTVRR
jgi:hypothetical protein